MVSSEIEEWADAYIEATQSEDRLKNDYPLWWAIERFMTLVDKDPESCWKAILAVLAKDPPQQVIGVLAAGPLEDLIDFAGDRFIDRIETEARRNPDFRNLLGGVWESGSKEVWARVDRCRGEPW